MLNWDQILDTVSFDSDPVVTCSIFMEKETGSNDCCCALGARVAGVPG